MTLKFQCQKTIKQVRQSEALRALFSSSLRYSSLLIVSSSRATSSGRRSPSAYSATSSSSSSGLSAKNARFATSSSHSNSFLTTSLHCFKHGGVLQHVGKNKKSNFRPTYEDVLKLSCSSVSICHMHLAHLTIHIVLSLQ